MCVDVVGIVAALPAKIDVPDRSAGQEEARLPDLALRVANPAALEAARLRTFDFYQTLKPRQATVQPAVIVDIDEASMSAYGQWPWPRTLLADLVTKLARLGSVVIAFDIIFAEPDRMSPGIAADSFRNLDPETRAQLLKLPSNDDALADATGLLVGYMHNLSKRTTLYANYGTIHHKQKTSVRYPISWSAATPLSSENPQGVQFGIRHAF